MSRLSGQCSRATRGVEPWRQQPKLRFNIKVHARFGDGNALARGEHCGNPQQGYLGPVIDGRVPYITTTSRADFLSAFNKRVNFYSPDRVHRYFRTSCRELIWKLTPKVHEKIQWGPEIYRPWVAQFDSEKQARMEKEYLTQGLERLGDYSRKEIFTKIESLVKDHDTVAPRVIFKGTDYYNMIAGPIFKVLMERFKTCENNVKEMPFLLGYKQHTPEIVDFLESSSHGGPPKSWIEADFTANDKTQVKDIHELEIMYMERLGAPRWFCDLHREASKKFSVYNTKYGVSAVIENELATGAVDTTFRNSFLNLSIFYAWQKKYKVRARVAVLGDDMLAGLDRRVRRAAYHYEAIAKLACMEAKVTTGKHLHNMHFLSKHFVPVTRGEQVHVMLPFIGKILAKFNARPNSNQAVSDDEYMAGKSLSHCYEYRFCHVIRDLFVERANYHLRRSGGLFSLEGMSYHVRQYSVHKGLIESMIEGSTSWPDLVTEADLSLFWQTIAGLTFTDVFPLVKRVVLGVSFELLDAYALQHLRDY